MRDKLIELLRNAVVEVTYYASDDSPIITTPYNVVECGYEEWLADYLIAHGLTFATDNSVGDKKPITNGDRIRAMTDEELASMFSDMSDRCFCCNTDYLDEREPCPIRQNSAFTCHKTDFVTWLKQPVKEEI